MTDDYPDSTKLNATGGEPKGVHLSRDGDGLIGDDGDDGDGNGDNVPSTATVPLNSQSQLAPSKKKKRTKSKKKSPKAPLNQSSPPRIPIRNLFADGRYPHGELQSYEHMLENTGRVSTEEIQFQMRQRLHDDVFLNDYRKAAEVHRQVRRWTQDHVRPGQTLTDIAIGIEDGVRALLDNAGLAPGEALLSGMGFPTGLSLNNCVAHYTPNPGQKDVVLSSTDVMKVDFGVHINGWIVDSAFTMSFDPVYDNLLAAVKDATDTGIKVGNFC